VGYSYGAHVPKHWDTSGVDLVSTC